MLYSQDAGLWSPLISKEEKSEVNYDCTFREGITLSVGVLENTTFIIKYFNVG